MRTVAARQGTNYVALAGEFFVLGELALRGFDGTLTLGHTKEVDILVLNRRQRRTFKVEVKTTGRGVRRAKIFGQNYAWLMHERAAKLRDRDLIYVFVYLDRQKDSSRRPRYFVVPAGDVTAYIGWSHRHYLRHHRGLRRNPHSTIREFHIPAGGSQRRHLPSSWRDGRWRHWENNWAIFEPASGRAG